MATQREPTRATIEEDIEETQRQIRHSAELIQSAFEGLSSLHGRVREATSLRVQDGAPAVSSRSRTSVEETSGSSGSGDRSSMDPGHDAILLSSLNPPAAVADPAAPGQSLPGRARTADPALSTLRSEIMMSTESVRSRAGELDELRRAITTHTQDRQHQEALQRILRDSPHAHRHTTSGGTVDSFNRVSASLLPARSRRQLLETSLRQRSVDDSATSLGAMVTARAETRRMTQRLAEGSSGTTTTSSTIPSTLVFTPEPTSLSTASLSALAASLPVSGSSSAGPMPPGFATRLSRLAQEIQQDISRISQQSESLMSWISEHRTRIDAGLAAARPAERAPERSPPPSADRTPRAGYAEHARQNIAASDATALTPDMDSFMGLESRTGSEGGEGSAAAGSRFLEAMEARARRAAAFHELRLQRRQTGGSTDNVFNFLSDDRDGPLTGSSRMDGSPPSSSTQIPAPSTSTAGASNALNAESELAQSMARVRSALALARSRQARRHGGEDEDEPTETRSYRVRRRLNADGDEEDEPTRVVRNFSWRRESAAEARDSWDFDDDDADARRTWAQGSSYTRSHRPETEGDERGERGDDDTAWYAALRRLDALSRGRSTAGQSEEQQRRRWDSMFRMDEDGSLVDANGDETAYPVNLGQRQSTRAAILARLSSRQQETETAGDRTDEYERNRAAMVARAHALTSSMNATGAFSRTSTLPPPPPPPAVRPFSLVSTTQNTPGSLWNDSGVRVRIRSAAQRLDEDMRALDEARERVRSQSQSLSQPPAPRSRPTFYPLDYADTSASSSSSSPPLERSSANAADGDMDLEQPVWGSPTPFYPSPLPLPRVEETSALQARSRVYGGAKRVARMPRRRAPVAGR